MPASRARSRTAGDASGFSPSARGMPFGNGLKGPLTRPPLRSATLSPLGRGDFQCRARLVRSGRWRGSRRPPLPSGERVAERSGGRVRGRCCMRRIRRRTLGEVSAAVPSPATFSRTMGEPTATVSPISAPSQSTSPSTGDGISTVALSVMTAASSASSRTRSPTLTCHSTSSASATPSPTSGSLITCSPMLMPPSSRQTPGRRAPDQGK